MFSSTIIRGLVSTRSVMMLRALIHPETQSSVSLALNVETSGGGNESTEAGCAPPDPADRRGAKIQPHVQRALHQTCARVARDIRQQARQQEVGIVRPRLLDYHPLPCDHQRRRRRRRRRRLGRVPGWQLRGVRELDPLKRGVGGSAVSREQQGAAAAAEGGRGHGQTGEWGGRACAAASSPFRSSRAP